MRPSGYAIRTVPVGTRGALFLLSNSIRPQLALVDEAKRAGVQRIVKLSVQHAPDALGRIRLCGLMETCRP
jgi:hypothetical protein